MNNMKCELDAEGRCITCSDEALPVRVISIDQEAGAACVSVENTTEEVDITLIDDVVEGDVILVHGGVAIAIAEANPNRIDASDSAPVLANEAADA